MSISIYRIAHKDNFNQGMYRNDLFLCFELGDVEKRHPMPCDDSELKDFWYSKFKINNHLFGFASEEQVKFWIHTEEARRYISTNNLLVYVIKPKGIRGTDWQIGSTQAIFDQEQHELVKTIHPAIFFNIPELMNATNS